MILMRAVRFPLVIASWLLLTGTGMANTPGQISAICDEAGAFAAAQNQVPPAVMQAITLTETGRRLEGRQRPWPWTVNMEGKGVWFATREEALSYVRENFDRGARSFDVGCFQINYRWHGNAFASIEDMFDPRLNALYAGRFLRGLFEETRSWSESAGAYHSRTPQFATRYRARFDQILARLQGGEPAPDSAPVQLVAATPEPDPLPATVRLPIAAPSKFGSLAAIGATIQGRSLLTPARSALY